MRVLYVTPGLGGSGGAERSLASMAPYWRGKFELHIVTFSDRLELSSQIAESGATITNLGAAPLHIIARRLRRTIRELEPDLVHSVLFSADIATRLAAPRHVPVSSSLVNVNYGSDQWRAPGRSRSKFRAAQLADAITAQRVTRFHALSEHVATVMSKRLAIPRSIVDVIPRGRDRTEVGYPSMERRRQVRHNLGLEDRPVIVAAARHEWQKGIDVLLQALPAIREAVPDVAVLIGGREGSETPRLRAIAARNGLEPDSVFIGPRNDVADLMCAADVFCVPSRWEGLGSIVVEAMALGAPVVSADIAPIRELDPGGQWLRFFMPENSIDLARQVVSVLTGPSDASRSEHAISRFDASFSSERIAARMAGFFERTARTKAALRT